MSLLIKKANELFVAKKFKAAMEEYSSIQRAYPSLAGFFVLNIELCKKRLLKNIANITITFTTISERLHLLEPVIESLHKQTVKPSKILLNISEEAYLLDKGVDKSSKTLLGLKNKFPLLHINWVKNTGPFRKIVPFMEQYYNSGDKEERVFITVDDDTVYPDYFVEKLYQEFNEHDCVVAFRGRYITLENTSIATYNKWELGKDKTHIANLPTGKDGVIYSTKFFTKDFIDIQKAVELAPTADDLWIKWHCALNGVKAKILNPEAATSDYKSFPVVDYSAEYRDVSLFKAHNSNGSGGKNDKSVKSLELYFKSRYSYNLADILSLMEA